MQLSLIERLKHVPTVEQYCVVKYQLTIRQGMVLVYLAK